MEFSDIFLLVVGCLVAVTALTRMMIARRDKLVAEVQMQVEREQQKKKKKKKAA